jgi:hypothetical protein
MAEGYSWTNSGHHICHRRSANATNMPGHEKYAPTAFWNLILKTNVKLLKSPLITLKITNKQI